MIFGQSHKSLEDAVVEGLLAGEKTVKEILLFPSVHHFGVSVQAVYKALKRLLEAQVIVKHRVRYAVNTEWVERLHAEATIAAPLLLSVGDTVTYTFSTFNQTDVYWKHLAYMVPKEIQKSTFLSYLPHNFWLQIPSRQESEARYYAHFSETKRDGFMVIGGDSETDHAFAKSIRNEYLRVNTIASKKFNRTDHLVVMGDYVINTRLTKDVAERIDELYTTYKGAELEAQLLPVLHSPVTIKIIISRNRKKASHLAKLITQDFYVPKIVKERIFVESGVDEGW